LSADFTVQKGIARSKRLILVSPSLQAEGSGQIDLAKRHLSIHLNVQYTGKKTKILDIQKKAGGSIPLIITVTFYHIHAEVDYSLLLQQIARVKIDKTLKKVREHLDREIEGVGEGWEEPLDILHKKVQRFLK
jgi:hypothetical protein